MRGCWVWVCHLRAIKKFFACRLEMKWLSKVKETKNVSEKLCQHMRWLKKIPSLETIKLFCLCFRRRKILDIFFHLVTLPLKSLEIFLSWALGKYFFFRWINWIFFIDFFEEAKLTCTLKNCWRNFNFVPIVDFKISYDLMKYCFQEKIVILLLAYHKLILTM